MNANRQSVGLGWLIGILLALFWMSAPARAESGEVRLARQFGLSYLQTHVMEAMGLVEKQLAAAGLPSVKVTWAQFSNGPAMNESLLSGNLDFATGGVPSFITLWDKSRGAYVGLAALASMPAVLTTRRPEIKSLRDFTEADRIAVPAVRVSMQGLLLEMLSEATFGKGQHARLDHLTVTLPHPEATSALLSGRTEITAHFTAAPYYYIQEKDPKIHRVLSSYEFLGGPSTYSLMWASKQFMEQNPKITAAVLSALDEATEFIHSDPRGAANMYIKAEKVKLDPELVEAIVRDPENVFTTAPQNFERFVEFMSRTQAIRQRASTWRDLFSPLIAMRPGS